MIKNLKMMSPKFIFSIVNIVCYARTQHRYELTVDPCVERKSSEALPKLHTAAVSSP